MEAVLFLCIASVVVLLSLATAAHQNSKRDKSWASFAAMRNLDFFADETAIVGVVDGIRARITIEVTGSGRSKQTFTVYEVDLIEHAPPDLSLHKQGFFQSAVKLFGGQDIEVGRPEFDDAFMVKGHDEFEIKRWLQDRRIQNALLSLQAFNPSFCLQHGALKTRMPGTQLDHHDLAAQLSALVKAGHACESTPLLSTSAPVLELEESKSAQPDPPVEPDDDVIW